MRLGIDRLLRNSTQTPSCKCIFCLPLSFLSLFFAASLVIFEWRNRRISRRQHIKAFHRVVFPLLQQTRRQRRRGGTYRNTNTTRPWPHAGIDAVTQPSPAGEASWGEFTLLNCSV